MTIETSVQTGVQRIARLTPLDAIVKLVQSRVVPVAPRRVGLAEAVGAVLAQDVQPPQCPPRPTALRDGFAVASAEIADAGPYTPMPLGLTACRIDVGGALPSGTDAVAPLDTVALRGSRAEAIATVGPGDGVLAVGADAAPAVALRRAGERLRPLDLAVIAAAEIAEATVRAPRLILARASAARTAMLDAAQAALSRCATSAGCIVRSASSLSQALDDSQCDAVIGIGGTGSGRRDGAVQELARLGQIEAHGIAIGPGETTAFGFVGQRPVLLIPGRLDSALATWLLVGRHIVAKLAGGKVEDMPTILPLRRKVTSTIGITEIVAVSCSGGMAEPLGSGYLSLTALARSDGFIVVPAESEGCAAGAEVAVKPWP